MSEHGAAGSMPISTACPTPCAPIRCISHALFNRHIDRGRSDEAIAVILRQSRADAALASPNAGRAGGAALRARRCAMATRRPPMSSPPSTGWFRAPPMPISNGSRATSPCATSRIPTSRLTISSGSRRGGTPISLGPGRLLDRARAGSAGRFRSRRHRLCAGAPIPDQLLWPACRRTRRPALRPGAGGGETFPDWRAAPFAIAPLYEGGRAAAGGGRAQSGRTVLDPSGRARIAPGRRQTGRMARDLGPAASAGDVGQDRRPARHHPAAAYYALHPMAEMDLPCRWKWLSPSHAAKANSITAWSAARARWG